MNMTETATRSVVVERKFAHPPEKVWRALTQGALIEEWLLKNDFQPVVGHQFKLRNEPMPQWDGEYTAFGKVIQGMSNAQVIAGAPTRPGTESPADKIVIKSITLQPRANFVKP